MEEEQPAIEERLVLSPQKIARPRRQRLAAQWLERLRQMPTEQRVAALAPFVELYRKDPRARQLADEMVAAGGVPTRKAVRASFAQKDREWRERFLGPTALAAVREERLRSLGFDSAAVGPAARDWVRGYWIEHGEGPTWSELATSMGWDRAHQELFIRQLARDGYLAYRTHQPRSLAAR